MFTTAELADLRAASLEAMDAVATVKRAALGSGGSSGGHTYGELEGEESDVDQDPGDPVVTGVRCRVVEAGSGTEGQTGGEIVAVAPYLVQIDGIVDLRAADSIAVEFDDGRTARFAVVHVETPISYQVNTRAFCRRAD